ncbi:MAG TPA: histidine kinase dimerization/phospho-acceptor domain-containing protein [Puia sp.]|nr:histidine kinase dimerization/phospho-acceptor domain-containing protein [Puia sp.]
MVKRSTRLGIAIFSLVIVGFVVVQYCWIRSLQDTRLRAFRIRTLSALASIQEKIPLTGSWNEWSDTAIGATLFKSFSSMGLGDIHFEYSIGSGHNRLTSHGFTQKMTTDPENLILYRPLLRNDQPMPPDVLLTMVIPAWKKLALKGMGRIFAMCALLTIMVITVFCYALILDKRREQLSDDNRTDLVLRLTQELENPLSSMSVALEALANDKVIHNSEKRQFYQEIINSESKHMSEYVKKIFEQQNTGKM